ncbi:MAG: OmpA family protein [Terracidiphilus sp.]
MAVSLSRQFAVVILASALGVPVWAAQQTDTAAQQQQTNAQSAPPSASQPSPEGGTYVPPPKEGFWGRVNPFARKKWVKRQLDPINSQLDELDQVNARNARQIQDVDARAQAGIQKAQSTADSANQTATSAGNQAQQANTTAEQASNTVQQLNTTVTGLDQYHQVTSFDVAFRGESPVLTGAAREQLDSLAASVTGHDGYILQIDAQSPLAGSAGVESSQRMAEAIERYLVTQHQIPIYRMHAVALGNQQTTDAANDNGRPERVHRSNVHVQLMENSLAAQGAAPPQGTASLSGAERQ